MTGPPVKSGAGPTLRLLRICIERARGTVRPCLRAASRQKSAM